MMALEPDDRKDPKRECVVLSRGREVVGPSYLRVTGIAAKVTDKRESSDYPSRVNQVSQNSNTDRQADRIGQATQVSPNSNTD
jgi:hypothetical protein